jgi:hypothetical protein
MLQFWSLAMLVLLASCPLTAQTLPSMPIGPPSADQPCDQDPAADPAQPPSTRYAPCPPPPAPAPLPAPTNPKRILGLIPNFTTTDDSAATRSPLSGHQKHVLALDQMFDFSAHAGNFLQASIQQVTSGQPHYATDAFGKRLLAAEADQITSCLFIYGTLPTLLHDDPRYFRRVDGPPISRAWYAVTRTVVGRTDRGAATFNTSQLLGQFTQASLSNAYYPRQDRTVGGTLTNWAVQLVYNSAFNVVKEFYPDVVARLHRHPMGS